MTQTGMVRPDSGRAWAVCIAVALSNAVAFGTLYTFGTFFDSMATEFGTGRGPTAVIFGITLLFFFGFGVVSGPLSDRIPAYQLLLGGGTLFVVGLLVTSRVHHLALGYLTYGLGVGLGSGIFVAPLTAIVGRLFVRRRTIALGVTAAGNGLGTLVLVPVSASLIKHHGWRTTYVILALIGAIVFGLSVGIIAGARSMTAAARRVKPLVLLREKFFRDAFLTTLLMSIGLYIAFAFIVPFAKDDGVAASSASRLMAFVGLSSILGRLLLSGVLARRFGAIGVFRGSLALQPVAYLIWLFSDGRLVLLVVFALVLGVAYGGFVAVLPELIITRYGLAEVGSRTGTLFLPFGLGGLIGPPLGGWLNDFTNGHVVPILAVIGLLLAASFTARTMRARTI